MTINALIAELRTQLSLMKTDEDRENALRALLEGFCPTCGVMLDKPDTKHSQRAFYCIRVDQ